MSRIRVFRIWFAPVLFLVLSAVDALAAQPEVWRRRIEVGKVSLHRGNYEQAKNAFRDALEAAKKLPEDFQVRSLHYSGIAYFRLGQYLEAERALKKGLLIAERLWSAENQLVTQLRNHLGTVHVYTGRYTRAEKAFRQVLEIERSRSKPDPGNLSSALNNLSHILVMRGRHEDALPMQREAVAIRETAFGAEHRWVVSLNNLSVQLRLADRRGGGSSVEGVANLGEAARNGTP